MENQTSHNDHQAKDPSIAFSASEFNLDDFDFKPLNKGLGFHQEERKNGILPTNNKNISVTRGVKSPVAAGLGISNPNVADKGIQSMNALSAFYSESQTEEVEEILTNVLNEAVEYKTAKTLNQFAAWFLDLVIVLAISSSLLGLFVLVSGLSIAKFYQVIGPNDLILFGASSFSIFYLSYFSILDLQSTPGKSLLNLQLLRENNKEVSLRDSFLRSLITLLSFVTLGLPCLIDFQGKLTDTKVVEDV